MKKPKLAKRDLHLPPGATEEMFQAYHATRRAEVKKYKFKPWQFFAVDLYPDSKWALHAPAPDAGAPGEPKSFGTLMSESWPRAHRIRLEELSRDPHHYDDCDAYLRAREAELDDEES